MFTRVQPVASAARQRLVVADAAGQLDLDVAARPHHLGQQRGVGAAAERRVQVDQVDPVGRRRRPRPARRPAARRTWSRCRPGPAPGGRPGRRRRPRRAAGRRSRATTLRLGGRRRRSPAGGADRLGGAAPERLRRPPDPGDDQRRRAVVGPVSAGRSRRRRSSGITGVPRCLISSVPIAVPARPSRRRSSPGTARRPAPGTPRTPGGRPPARSGRPGAGRAATARAGPRSAGPGAPGPPPASGSTITLRRPGRTAASSGSSLVTSQRRPVRPDTQHRRPPGHRGQLGRPQHGLPGAAVQRDDLHLAGPGQRVVVDAGRHPQHRRPVGVHARPGRRPTAACDAEVIRRPVPSRRAGSA